MYIFFNHFSVGETPANSLSRGKQSIDYKFDYNYGHADFSWARKYCLLPNFGIQILFVQYTNLLSNNLLLPRKICTILNAHQNYYDVTF